MRVHESDRTCPLPPATASLPLRPFFFSSIQISPPPRPRCPCVLFFPGDADQLGAERPGRLDEWPPGSPRKALEVGDALAPYQGCERFHVSLRAGGRQATQMEFAIEGTRIEVDARCRKGPALQVLCPKVACQSTIQSMPVLWLAVATVRSTCADAQDTVPRRQPRRPRQRTRPRRTGRKAVE